jgi:hypothetical protein
MSLFRSELCKCHTTKYPEMTEIWIPHSPHLLGCHKVIAAIVTRRPIMEIAGCVRRLSP